MILEFILKQPHKPLRFRLETEPTDLLVIPHEYLLVNDSLVERILVTDEDAIEAENEKRKEARLEELVRKPRTWRADKWDLRLFPKRTWVMHLTEITKIPGQIVG